MQINCLPIWKGFYLYMSKILQIGDINIKISSLRPTVKSINILCKLKILLRTFICMYNREIEVI